MKVFLPSAATQVQQQWETNTANRALAVRASIPKWYPQLLTFHWPKQVHSHAVIINAILPGAQKGKKKWKYLMTGTDDYHSSSASSCGFKEAHVGFRSSWVVTAFKGGSYSCWFLWTHYFICSSILLIRSGEIFITFLALLHLALLLKIKLIKSSLLKSTIWELGRVIGNGFPPS